MAEALMAADFEDEEQKDVGTEGYRSPVPQEVMALDAANNTEV